MYKLFRIEDNTRGAMAFVLVAEGVRGKLGPLLHQLSRQATKEHPQGKIPHAMYDANGMLVSRTF